MARADRGDLDPRASLRYSSYIDPSTGARLSKTFTLHTVPNGAADRDDAPSADDDDDTRPLISRSPRRPSCDFIKSQVTRIWRFVRSDTGKGVLKCALAYLLGSLATFVPGLSQLFGRQNSKHMVATITVYFHPARSLGSMLDALLLALAAFAYTAALSLLSMSVTVLFAGPLDLIPVGHAIVLVVFVGGGLGLVGWVKLRKNDPLVNIACSLTSLGLITILTREGAVQAGDFSLDTISQILKMIIAGVVATMVVSFSIFPISGRARLRANLLDVTDCLADMLALITSSFLSGNEAELKDATLTGISDQHNRLVATTPQKLKESRYEHYLLGTERQAVIETRLAHCIQRIAQSIGGLRSAAAMQFVVTQEPPFGSEQRSEALATPSWRDSLDRHPFFKDAPPAAPTVPSSDPPFRTPAQIFELFIQNLGPSMRSLAFTLKEILDDFPFDAAKHYAVTTNPKFKVSLDRALDMYKEYRANALTIVYDQKDMDRSRPIPVQADWEDAAASCGHFSFSLVEVAESVKEYLVILDELQLEVDERPCGRTWGWLKFWRSADAQTDLDGLDPEFAAVIRRSAELGLEFDKPRFQASPRYDSSQWPRRNRVQHHIYRRIYDAFALFRRDDVKFAIKVGLGAMLYALPSFVPATRPFYSHWRGEWGLLTYMLVCNMTIGAANTTGYSRILGTCLGAALAIVAWEISAQSPVALAALGFGMAYWTAYIIIGKGKGPMGRFIMLTYNLSALYAYSLAARDDDDGQDEEDARRNPLILPIVGHRVAAVISGCIWGLIITRAVWSISARRRLKDGLSLLWLRMGLIWKRDPLATLTEGLHPDGYMNLHEEFYLQKFLTHLQSLTDASKSEFELRRPFPHAAYARILRSTEQMLDAFHAMNEVIVKNLTATPGEEALLKATVHERAQLCGRISHLFSVLASSMKLEYSIANDALPNIEHTRDRLLAKIFAYRRGDAVDQRTSDEDYSLLYTYALVTGQLNMGIQQVLTEVENLFGVLDDELLRLS